MGKRYFHVCTKGSDLKWMFRDDRDFVVGVNRVGICILNTDVTLLDFILMDTHVHFILYGSMPECKEFIKRYKQLTGRYIFEKYHISGHLAEVDTTIVPVNTEEHLMEEMAYADRNSIAAGYKCLPTEYPWGSARYMFRDKISSEMGTYSSPDQLTDRELREILCSRVTIPRNWRIDLNGMIDPRCFTNVQKAESIFKSPNRYLYFLSKKVEGSVEVRHSQGTKSLIPDKEMRRIVEHLAVEMFGIENKTLLDVKSRILLAKKLRYEYASTPKQISRMLQLEIDIVKGFV